MISFTFSSGYCLLQGLQVVTACQNTKRQAYCSISSAVLCSNINIEVFLYSLKCHTSFKLFDFCFVGFCLVCLAFMINEIHLWWWLVFRYITFIKILTKIGKQIHIVKTESASTIVILLSCSLTQLRYQKIEWYKLRSKMTTTAYQKHTSSLDYVTLTGEDRDASFSFDIVVWKLPMRSWDPSPS